MFALVDLEESGGMGDLLPAVSVHSHPGESPTKACSFLHRLTHRPAFASLRMRAVSLLLLAPGILALPQDLGSLLGGFLANRGGGRSLQDTVRNIINNPVIQERILNNDLNPCPVR